MNKKTLSSYRSKKEEIKELRDKLQNINEGGSLISNNTILNYTSGYPVPQAVVGVDGEKINRYWNRVNLLSKECREVEDFIEAIPDSIIRRIFRMYYIDGLSQRDIARAVHMDRSRVSRKIDDFINSL